MSTANDTGVRPVASWGRDVMSALLSVQWMRHCFWNPVVPADYPLPSGAQARWLLHVQRRLERGTYTAVMDVRDDVQRILRTAVQYHSNTGMYKDPGVLACARECERAVKRVDAKFIRRNRARTLAQRATVRLKRIREDQKAHKQRVTAREQRRAAPRTVTDEDGARGGDERLVDHVSGDEAFGCAPCHDEPIRDAPSFVPSSLPSVVCAGNDVSDPKIHVDAARGDARTGAPDGDAQFGHVSMVAAEAVPANSVASVMARVQSDVNDVGSGGDGDAAERSDELSSADGSDYSISERSENYVSAKSIKEAEVMSAECNDTARRVRFHGVAKTTAAPAVTCVEVVMPIALDADPAQATPSSYAESRDAVVSAVRNAEARVSDFAEALGACDEDERLNDACIRGRVLLTRVHY